MDRSPGFIDAIAGDGRPLLVFSALMLLLAGLFVIVQSGVGVFLPHDVVHLGMDADALSAFFGGRITLFMFHDRVAFGGSIMSVGVLYLWLTLLPLRAGDRWAWWAFAWSGALGFGSFLTYLGYGYLDTWHGVSTLLLIPFFVAGLWRTRALLKGPAIRPKPRTFRWPQDPRQWGLALLHFMAGGLFVGGMVIMGVGMTTVFVPQDLRYMNVSGCEAIDAISPRLIPLIAHDRAAFGGGLATIGLLLATILLNARMDRALWQALAITLSIGFGSAIGVHFAIGYTDLVHLLPAYLGAAIAFIGLVLSCMGPSGPSADT